MWNDQLPESEEFFPDSRGRDFQEHLILGQAIAPRKPWLDCATIV